MVELFFVVPTHVYIDQCIDVLNVFKANYKDNYVTLFEVSLVSLLLNLNMFVTWIWFSVAASSLDSLISRRSQIHLLNCAVLNWKLVCKNLLDW